jgi:hypothetical protein
MAAARVACASSGTVVLAAPGRNLRAGIAYKYSEVQCPHPEGQNAIWDTTAPAATPASAPTSAPAASANAASAAKPEVNAAADAPPAAAEEKFLLAEGYKPEIRNGTGK